MDRPTTRLDRFDSPQARTFAGPRGIRVGLVEAPRPRRLASVVGEAVYEVVWSAAALQVVVLMGHLVGVILFAVNDRAATLRSLAGFSLFVWGLAGLYLVLTLVTRLTPSPFPEEPAWRDDGADLS